MLIANAVSSIARAKSSYAWRTNSYFGCDCFVYLSLCIGWLLKPDQYITAFHTPDLPLTSSSSTSLFTACIGLEASFALLNFWLFKAMHLYSTLAALGTPGIYHCFDDEGDNWKQTTPWLHAVLLSSLCSLRNIQGET